MKKSKEKELKFDEEELETIYQIVKDYEEKIPNDPENYHFYNDYDEEPVDKKIIRTILNRIGKNLSSKNKDLIDKDFLRKKYSFYNNSINEKISSVIDKGI